MGTGSHSKTLEAVRKRKTQNITFSVRIKQTKMIFSLIGMVLLQSVGAKICWKECASDTSVPQAKFRCEGTEGPPCIVERGSTVHLDVAWQNPGVTNMTQSTVWVSGWGIEIPWVSTHCAHGLYAEQINFETQGCDPTWKLICKGWDGDRRLSILGSWYWMSSICAGTTEQVLLPNSHPGDVSSWKVRSQVEVLRQRLAGQRD